jgi:Small protein A (tmRNA-binding)
MIDALHEGMTKNQVIFLLGTPALRNLFHKEQWNYVYYLKPRFGQTSIRKLEITFDEDGRVESFKSDKMPDETNADLAILGERARESTLKRQEEIEKEKQEIQQPASEEAQQAAETEPSKEAAETPAAQ